MSITIDDILAPAGLVARRLPNYEHRPEQLEMARAVARAFDDREHLLAEAGTGVGKSFAYLVPAVLRAWEHKQRVVVSTCTIALQEQLIRKDLPFLAETLKDAGVDFHAVLGKGRNNYLCLRRLAMLMKHRERLLSNERHQARLDRIAQWAMTTRTGEMQELDFDPTPALWNKLCADGALCRGQRCAQASKCFLRAARRELLEGDILVVNHAMLLTDLSLPLSSRLLGEYKLVVMDEAHTVESVASDQFGRAVSNANVANLLRELYNDRTNRGLLGLMDARDAVAAVNQAGRAAEAFFADLADYAGQGVARSGRLQQAEVVPDSVTPALGALVGKLRELRKQAGNDEQKFELAGYEARLLEIKDMLADLILQKQDDHAYWRTCRRLKDHRQMVTLASAPIHVAPMLKKLLFDEAHSVILTSATLSTAGGRSENGATRGGFEYIRGRLGVEDGEDLLLASPFNFRRQAKLYIETRLGDPNRLEEFVPAAGEAIRHYVAESQGRCFILTTSYAMLDALAEDLEDWCDENDYELLTQGGHMQRSAMLEHFRAKPRCVLLGTMSFWQGVDVSGEALSNVIIVKLPFAVPDEPIIEARMDSIRAAGGNPFGEFQLPQAIILFKQGFGRLIRSRSDTGFVVVLDHRIVTKSYGQAFIEALPDIEVVRDEFCNQRNGRPPIPPAASDELWEYT
ncbi:MAG: helicase [Phycisphaerae bacterium]|nr:helicase [Phycisphaerae bacterium]